MSKTINVIGVLSTSMKPDDPIPVSPQVWLCLNQWGTTELGGKAPVLSGSLMTPAEVDEFVSNLKADLDRAAVEAKSKLKAGKIKVDRILQDRSRD